jgi:hypothetical protein
MSALSIVLLSVRGVTSVGKGCHIHDTRGAARQAPLQSWVLEGSVSETPLEAHFLEKPSFSAAVLVLGQTHILIGRPRMTLVTSLEIISPQQRGRRPQSGCVRNGSAYRR